MTKVAIPVNNYIILLNQDEILYCQSDNCYTTIYLKNQKSYVIVKSLTKFHLELEAGKFVRVSQSYIVNHEHIKQIDKKRKLIYIDDETKLPFTLSNKQLMEYIIPG
ncbi:LytR/AlgR family response regulator transcription factor [Desertivirga brevis]|uniref:LytR/AlgR family response regulator transcription factor n=1 Tax=Desertivirga brevis TaxID=2810310 RepID=UPI001A976938|nr:LytTR family DNA-binding domain-containing protein [Pedobacter sp. SYSU D00873]